MDEAHDDITESLSTSFSEFLTYFELKSMLSRAFPLDRDARRSNLANGVSSEPSRIPNKSGRSDRKA